MSSYTGGNYGAVGQKLNQQQIDLHGINAEASPDYGKIAEEAIKGRSKERRAAIEAETQVHRAGLDAMGTKKLYQIKADSDKEVANIKRPAKRFAGIVGAAGQIAGGFVLKKFNDEAKEREEKWEKRFEERMRATEEALSGSLPKPPMQETIDFEDPGGGLSTTQTSSQLTSATTVPTGGGYVKPQEMYTYLTKNKGLSHNKAIGLIANVQRESSFKLNNPGDGGTSNGLFQWNKDRLQRMQAAVPDWQTNWKGQIDHALSEPGESGNNYLNTTFATPNAAAAHWTRYFERPAHPDRDIQTQDEFISTYRFN